MSDEKVFRYVPTYIDPKTGLRTLAVACQGRYTWATPEGAYQWITHVTFGNSIDRIESIWGEGTAKTFEVRLVECWPGHLDPKGIYFD